MTLQQLHYFNEVVEQGSMNQAAQSLFVSQSSISSAIKELEEKLGITIFIRHNMGMRLTPEGKKLHYQILPFLEQEKKILAQYDSSTIHPASLTISSLHFPFVAEAFVKLVSNVKDENYQFLLKEHNMQYIIDDVTLEQSEIGIISISDINKKFILQVLSERNLSFHLIGELVPHAILSNKHPLALQTTLRMEELEKYPYLAFVLEYSSSHYSEEVELEGFKTPKRVIRLTDRTTMYSAMHATEGYSVGSGILPEGHCDKDIISIPIVVPEDTMCIGYIKPFRKSLSMIAKRFLDHLNDQF